MSISSLYDTAKQYADKIMLEQPSFFSGSGGSLCLILTESQEIIFGITSIRISDGRIITVPSEYNAIASMVVENKKKAVQMVILSFYDYSVCKPNAYCLNLLLRAGAGNAECQIAVSPEESVSASTMRADLSASAENPDTEDIPSEFLAGFDFGGENPFDNFVPEEEPQADVQLSGNDIPVQKVVPAGTEEQNIPPYQPYAQPFPQQPYIQPQYPQQPYSQPYMQPQYPQQPYIQPQYPQQPYVQHNMGMDYQQPYFQPQYPQQPYIQPQYQHQPYVQPNMGMDYQQPYFQPQYPYSQQSVYIENTASYKANPQNSVQSSQHINEDNTSANNSDMYTDDSEQSIMAKKLASLIDDSSRASGADNQPSNNQKSNEISKEEMIRRANQEKKAVKGGFFGKR